MNVGLNSARSGSSCLMSARVAQPGARLDAADLDDPGEDVGQRQEEQRGGVVVVEELLELVDRDAELEHEVAVGEHAALGPPGRAGGVDQGGQVERRGRRTPLLQLLVGDVAAEAAQGVDGVVGDRPDVVEVVEVAADLAHPGQVVGGLGDHGAGAGVAEDPVHLLGRGGLVDRHGDRAGEPDGVVEQRPLVAGLGDQRDPVAGLDAGGDQTLGDRADLGEELRGGDVLPGGLRAPGTATELHGGPGLAGVGHHVVGEVAGGRDLGRQRGGELAHRLRLPRAPRGRPIRYARCPNRPRAPRGTRWPSRRPRRS